MAYQDKRIEIVEKAEEIHNQVRLARKMGVSNKDIILGIVEQHSPINVRYVAFMVEVGVFALHGYGHQFFNYISDKKMAYQAANPGGVSRSGFIVDHEDFTRFILDSTNC